MEKNGLHVRSEGLSSFHFEYKTEKIRCRLREKNKQVRRPKTKEEMRWSSGQTWTQVLEPTGNLVFTLEDYFGYDSRLRREWLETKTRPFEEMVPDIVATLILAGPALVKLREEREAESRRRAEAERLRQIEQARRKKERNQWRSLVEHAQRHEKAMKVKALLAALEGTASDRSAMIGDRALTD